LLDAAAHARRLGDADRLVAAVLANERGAFGDIGPVDAERLAVLEAALAVVGEADSRARALLLATLASTLNFSGDFVRCAAFAAEAEAIARRLGDDDALLRVLNLTFLSLWVPDRLARTVAVSEEALELAARVADPVAQFWAAQDRFYAMASSANRSGIDQGLELATTLAEELGQPYLSWWARVGQGLRLALLGDTDQAERLATDAMALGTDNGQPGALPTFAAIFVTVRWHQSRLDEVRPLLAQTVADNPGTPGFEAGYAMVLCECGDFDEARGLLEGARSADFYASTYDYTWLTNTTLWADTAAWLDDRPAASLLFERLAPFESHGVATVPTFTGTVGMYLARLAGVLGRDDDARGLFARADVQLRALGAPFWHARNQVEWARLLINGGADTDVDHARELLAEATDTAIAYGCADIERRAHELTAALP
jgi:hypothetical protein